METFQERDFPRLIELVFDAALDGRRWQAFIDGVSESFDGAGGILYCFNRERAVTDFVTKFSSDAAFTVSTVQSYLKVNPHPPATCTAEAAGAVNLVRADAGSNCRRSISINGWARPKDIPADHFNLPLCTSNGHVVVLAVAPHCSMLRKNLETYKQRLEILAPHFIRAIKLAHLVEETHHPTPPLKLTLDAIRASAVVLDAGNRIVATNRLADQLLRIEQVFDLDRSGALHATAPEQGARLAAAIAAARAGASAPVKLTSTATGRCYLVWVVPLAPHSVQKPESEFDNRIRFIGVEGSKANVLLLACDLDEATGISVEDLITRFGLTRAEARLSSALVAGRSLGDYARETGLSRNTARNQLATIFEKTGTRRQAALVAHVIGSVWTANVH